MALSKEAYQALEDIVGPEDISAEPAILDTYSWMYDIELTNPDHSGWHVRRPEAIVLPASTEEVQAVVKACNRHGVKYRPFSTGWSPGGLPSTEGVIILDLRLMERILEIDEKNMIAVVEPYVNTAQLQAEAMKLGLSCHITGAGCSCSALAGAAAGGGGGPSNLFMGTGAENLLAMEWVLPNGEILRSGSFGSGSGWFCGEGPGPSLRGIRGFGGNLGVFTKCALKLSPWPGPAVLPVEGTVPAYISPLPDNIRSYNLALPSWPAYGEIHYKIYDSEIGYIGEREFGKWGEDLGPAYIVMYNDPTLSLDYLDEVVKRPEVRKLTEEMRHFTFQFILAGMTPGDIEYQEKVLEQILADTGGHKIAAMSTPQMEGYTALYLVRVPTKNDNYVLGGAGRRSFAPNGIPDLMVANIPPVIQLMKKYQQSGLLVQQGADALKGRVAFSGGGGTFGYEERANWGIKDLESIKGVLEYYEDSAKLGRELRLPNAQSRLEGEVSTEEQQATLARASQPARFHWQWKFKQMLDPNEAGDSKNYPALKEPPKE